MGEHRFKPPAPPKENPHLRPTPKFDYQIGAVLDTKRLPKPNLCIMPDEAEVVEADGKRFVKVGDTVAKEPVADDAILVRVSDPPKDEYFDLVVMLRIDMTKGGGVVLPGGGLPQVQVQVMELFRTDFKEFMDRCNGVLETKGPQPGLLVPAKG